MTAKSQRVISYWCLPCDADSGRYTKVIQSLAAETGAPCLHPHITLGATHHRVSDLSALIDALNGLVLHPSEIQSTDIYTRSLYVRLDPTDILLKARATLEHLPGFRSGRDFDPHISLHYGAPPKNSSAREDVKRLLSAPVHFDKLVEMDISVPANRHADLSDWTVIKTHQV